MNTNLSKHQETMEDKEDWPAVVNGIIIRLNNSRYRYVTRQIFDGRVDGD